MPRFLLTKERITCDSFSGRDETMKRQSG